MASRSSGSMGVMVALVIFILLTIALMLTNMLTWTKLQQARTDRESAATSLSKYVAQNEETRDDITRIRGQAEQERRSVVMHLLQQRRDLMTQLAGDPNLNPTNFLQSVQSAFSASPGAAAAGVQADGVVLTNVRNTLARLDELTSNLERYRTEVETAGNRLEEEVARRESLTANHRETIEGIQQEIDRLREQVDEYAAATTEHQGWMDGRVEQIRADMEEQISSLEAAVDKAENEIARLEQDNRTLIETVKATRISGQSEADLADGEVVRVLQDDNVFINRGRNDQIVLGMTFDVYSNATELRRNAQGQIPAGKATIEVTQVGQTTSTARIVRGTMGRGVVEGDIVVNPIYDPDKKYSFFVFGNFDLDGENGPSDLETQLVKSRIRDWGGEIRDEFRGDIDFLVLGQQPVRPVQPPTNAPLVVWQRYENDVRFYTQYQDYLTKADSLSVPVLNQNRLLTLIGYYAY